MVDARWNQHDWERELKEILKGTSYTLLSVKSYHSGGHSDVAEIRLRTPKQSKTSSGKKAIAKRHLHPATTYALESVIMDPEILHNREVATLQGHKQSKPLGSRIFPSLYHSSERGPVIIMEHIPGKSIAEKLKQENSKEEGDVFPVLCDLVRLVAEFNGKSIAHRNELLRTFPILESRARTYLTTRHTSLANRLHENQTSDRSYNPREIGEELRALSESFCLPLVGSHGEMNPAHAYVGTRQQSSRKYFRVIDGETFGLYEAPHDLADALTIAQLGPTGTLKRNTFENLVWRYLAFREAISSGDNDSLERLEVSTNGDFKDYLSSSQTMTGAEYARFTLGLYAHMIRKTGELVGRGVIGQQQGEKGIGTLFGWVAGSQELIQYTGENEKAIRTYFSKLGDMFNLSGRVEINKRDLESISKAPVYVAVQDFAKNLPKSR